MDALMRWYDEESAPLHPILRAVRLHVDFVGIHPFVDGNGRTARLLLNLELIKAGYPAIVLPVQRRLAYYEALDAAHIDGDLTPFVDLVADCMREAFALYWFVLGVARLLLLWPDTNAFTNWQVSCFAKRIRYRITKIASFWGGDPH
jgi:hypothetical protein